MGEVAPTPLQDLRVLEISDRIAGGYCGKLLVDAGADVVKVEPDGPDPLRRFTVTGATPATGADAPLFHYLNAGKRSVTTGWQDLLVRADIVVVTATSSAATQRGIDPERLLQLAPRAVVVTISDFGWTGPWCQRSATEFTLQAWSGCTGFRGDPDGPPISIGVEVGEYIAGAFAAYGALAVYRRVSRGGGGEHLDLSMLEAMTLMQSCEWLHSQLMRVPPITRSLEVPSIERAKDGYVGITLVTAQQWLDFAAMVECPELTEVPELRFHWAAGGTATGSASSSARGCAAARSQRSSRPANCFGCRSLSWATAPRLRTWTISVRERCSCPIPPGFGSREPRG